MCTLSARQTRRRAYSGIGCLCFADTTGLLLDVHDHGPLDHPGSLRRRRQFLREGALGCLEGFHVGNIRGAGDFVAAIHGDVIGTVRRDQLHCGDHLGLELQPLFDIVDFRGDNDLRHDETSLGR